MNAKMIETLAAENGWTVTDEIALRTEVRRLLTPVRRVEIPGLGRSVPVYKD